jgi:hypothetical protein
MSDRNVEQLLNEIARYEQTIGIELDAVHHSVRPGYEMAIREAKDNLPSVRDSYRTRVFAQAVGFFLSGDHNKVATFVELAVKLGNVFVADAMAIYESMALKIEPSMGYSREFSVFQIAELTRLIRNVGESVGLKPSQIQPPNPKDARVLPTHQDVVFYIRDLVTEAMGESLNALLITQKLVNEAIARKFNSSVLAAVITNARPEAQAGLGQIFGTKAEVSIGPDDEVDDAYVLRAFETGKKNRPPRRR